MKSTLGLQVFYMLTVFFYFTSSYEADNPISNPGTPSFYRCGLYDCNMTDNSCNATTGRCHEGYRTCCDLSCRPKMAPCPATGENVVRNFTTNLQKLNSSAFEQKLEIAKQKILAFAAATPCWPAVRCNNDTCLPEYLNCSTGQCVERMSQCVMFWDKTTYARDRPNTTCYPPELCFRNNCVFNFWMCDDGECVHENVVCRGGKDCSDESDEKYCSGSCFPPPRCTNDSCSYGYFQCGDGKCILQEEVCNAITNCADGSDERNCSGACWPPNACNENGSCRPGFFGCDKGKCIASSHVCNMKNDCLDGSDEVRVGHGFKCVIGANYDTCVLPQKHLQDRTMQCKDHSDRCQVNGIELCFQCLDGLLTIAERQRCDGVIDCYDMSDECFCEDHMSAKVCRSLCLNINSVFHKNGKRTFQESLSNTIPPSCDCQVGKISCGVNGSCINPTQVCDGIVNCPSGLDESNCTQKAEANYKTIFCPGDVIGNILKKAVLCDGRPECFDFSDECHGSCAEPAPYCILKARFNSMFGPYEFLCDNGTQFLDALEVCDGQWSTCSPRIPEEEVGCPSRHYCLSGGKISIDKNLLCDGTPQCDDKSDELNCTDRFYCESGTPYSVSKSKKMDGKPDCVDGSDECPREMDNDALSSRKELLGALGFRVTTWIIGTIALVGNAVNFFGAAKALISKKNMKGISKVNYILLLNLAAADGLMGFYLITLCAKGLGFSGEYCRYDKEWRTSTICSNLGSLALTSSEMSVLILVSLTTLRLYSIKRPIKAQRATVKYPVVIIILMWFVTVVLATLPRYETLSDYFISDVWMPVPFKQFDSMDKNAMITFAQRLSVIKPTNQSPPFSSSWYDLTAYLDEQYSIKTKGFLGYFSHSSVCLPRFFVSAGEPGWAYSLFIILFNFLAVCYVCCAYIWISRTTRPNSSNRHRAKQLQKMNGRITRIVLTDFACWVPICFMSFLQLGAVQIPNQAYAFSAVILLPINSALNPFLYSDVSVSSLTPLKFVNKVSVKKEQDKPATLSLSNLSKQRKSVVTVSA